MKRSKVFPTLVLSLGVASLAAAQTNLGDLRDAPSGKFTPQDFDMLWAAVDAVSRGKTIGAIKKWENAATGNGGAIKLLDVFTSADGLDCRRLRVDNHAKSIKGSTQQVVCANADGKWMLDADASPAPVPRS
jgi:17 kDa outer membrane surface antigen